MRDWIRRSFKNRIFITVLLVTDEAGQLVGALNTNDLMRAKVI